MGASARGVGSDIFCAAAALIGCLLSMACASEVVGPPPPPTADCINILETTMGPSVCTLFISGSGCDMFAPDAPDPRYAGGCDAACGFCDLSQQPPPPPPAPEPPVEWPGCPTQMDTFLDEINSACCTAERPCAGAVPDACDQSCSEVRRCQL